MLHTELQPEQIATWLGRLVQIPSVTPPQAGPRAGVPGEARLANAVAGWFRDFGGEVHIDEVLPGRANVYGIWRGRTQRWVGVDVHMDTVGVEQMHGDPFSGELRDGRVYGRGAVDTKASLAVALALLEAMHRAGSTPQDNLLIAATMDEEETVLGAPAFAAWLQRRALMLDELIVAEPTRLYNANAARVSRTEEEAISLYRSIINKKTTSTDVQIQALLNLADYLYNSRGKKDEAIKVFKDYEHLFNEEIIFARVYAVYCWSIGKKEEAIRVLSSYVSLKTKQYKEDKNARFEITSLLLMYRSLDAIQKKEELKDKRRSGEIDIAMYEQINSDIKLLFLDICNKQCNVFFHEVKQIEDLSVLSSGARQNVIAALYQYVNVNIRLTKYQHALEASEYVVHNFPAHFSAQFINKMDFCKRNLPRSK